MTPTIRDLSESFCEHRTKYTTHNRFFLVCYLIMRCPKCNSPMGKNSYTCRYCGARFYKPSKSAKHNMGSNARISLISGTLLILIAGVLMLNEAWLFGIVLLIAGGLLLGIGKLMS